MSWFLLVIFLSLSFSCCLLEASNDKKLPSAVVVGTVYCDTCFQQEFSMSSHFISGASVAVECKDGNNLKPRFWKEVKTDEHGEFKIGLPFSVSKHVRKIKACTVKLLSSSEPYCAVASAATSSLLHLKSRKQGQHIFSAGFFSFKPLKEPNLCNQKPSIQTNTYTSKAKGVQACQQCTGPVLPGSSIRNHPGLSGFTLQNKNFEKINASRNILPPYLSQSFPFPFPLPDPTPTPGGFPNLPSLPLMPGLPPLPKLPPLPLLPGLPWVPPLPPTANKEPNPRKSSKEDQVLDQKVAQIDNIFPPNPLQPPRIPNPLQPPSLGPFPSFPFPPITGLRPSPPPTSLPAFPLPFPPPSPPTANKEPNPRKSSKEDQVLDQKVPQIDDIFPPNPFQPPLIPNPLQPPSLEPSPSFPFPPTTGLRPSPPPTSLPAFPFPFPPLIPPPTSPGTLLAPSPRSTSP